MRDVYNMLRHLRSDIADVQSNVSGMSVHGGLVMSRCSGAVFVNDRFIKVHNYTT
jgi:prolipoprotein diacylglyceryltransferase